MAEQLKAALAACIAPGMYAFCLVSMLDGVALAVAVSVSAAPGRSLAAVGVPPRRSAHIPWQDQSHTRLVAPRRVERLFFRKFGHFGGQWATLPCEWKRQTPYAGALCPHTVITLEPLPHLFGSMVGGLGGCLGLSSVHLDLANACQ